MTDTSQYHDTAKVSELQPDKKPNLSLVTGGHEVNEILDMIGIEHDPDSIVRRDSYHALLVDTNHGAYSEVWGIHYSVPHLSHTAYRLV